MATPAWPSTLPAPIADTTAQYAPTLDNVHSTSMETGAPKRRRRFTDVPETFNCTLKLTGAQCAILQTFKRTTLADVGNFTWLDVRSGATVTYQFVKDPTYTFVHGMVDQWSVALNLMMVP